MEAVSSISEIKTCLEKNVRSIDVKTLKDRLAFIRDINLNEFHDVESVEMAAFALCTEGECDIIVGSNRYHCTKGAVMVIFPNQLFKVDNADADCKGSIVVVSRAVLADSVAKISNMIDLFFHVYRNPVIYLNDNELAMMSDFYKVIEPLLEDRSNMFYEDTIKNILVAMFLFLCSLYSRKIVGKNEGGTRRESLTERFVYEVALHFRENRTVKFYADRLCINPKYLSVVVLGATGLHPGEIIDDFIMSQAKIYLRETDMTIQQISVELGFCDQSVFGKFFLRHQGCSPVTFRKKRENK